MVLAAGLGKRMRPITDTIPKPLIPVAGKPLIDWGLDALTAAGVRKAVVNVHYLADQMEAHLKNRSQPQIVISDERGQLLDSAGGIVRALPHLGSEPFLIINADTFWIDGATSNLRRLAARWDESRMDILLMVAALFQVSGYGGHGDFVMVQDGRLMRLSDIAGFDLSDAASLPFIYAGAAIVHPRIFANATGGPESLNRYFDRAIAENRLHGMQMDGLWLTVGTPDAIREAEAVLAAKV
ncbi:mannose-1-phosphate guanylyltransferase [Phyllobacterium phragmitis]|uniref:Mannose-1-phosphate guanylyltransferase n=2 Tax=Phyllobacterium phragmitis TaxID=2670329 RepID=A0A2S9IVE4_9HYPH|nr:mannose-1-phosphate guanylyltransferase [Phyllobacterium phragmitis]